MSGAIPSPLTTVESHRKKLSGTQALFRAEQRYRELLLGLPVACYTLNREGVIDFYNEAAVTLWGRAPELGCERWCGSLRFFAIDGKPLPHDECPAAIALKEQRSVRGIEAVVQRPDGTERWFISHPDPLFDSDGNCSGVVNVLVDITEQRQAQQALKQAKDAAVAANRSKDRFLAVLSHELRTPLTPILLTATLRESDPALPDAIREDMVTIRRNVELETKLIDDLLDHSRITTGKLTLRKETTDLNNIIQLASSICLPQIQAKQLEFALDLDEEAGCVNGDPARLQQVVWNLLKNAAKFTPSNGRVTLRTRRLDRDRVEIEIRDNGIGIEATALPRIFDAFEQADRRIMRQFGGLGLGLAISRAVIEQHGGSIRAESGGSGMGSTFTILLPAANSAEKNGSTGEIPHTPRLLVVEDHADTSAMLARLLKNSGYSVTTACTAAEALELVERERFDILVSDLGLPDATGCDLMRELHASHGMRGIAMSGYGMDDDIRKSLDAGFSQHLVKPVTALQVEQAIRRIIA